MHGGRGRRGKDHPLFAVPVKEVAVVGAVWQEAGDVGAVGFVFDFVKASCCVRVFGRTQGGALLVFVEVACLYSNRIVVAAFSRRVLHQRLEKPDLCCRVFFCHTLSELGDKSA